MSWDWSKDKLDGSDERLRMVFCIREDDKYVLNETFCLPKRNDHDYAERLEKLLRDYGLFIYAARRVLRSDYITVRNQVDMLARDIPQALEAYHEGFPADAYNIFEKMLNVLVKNLKDHLGGEREDGFLTVEQNGTSPTVSDLFRMRSVGDSKEYAPKDIFHVPATRRQAISSSRYSIAGYPSLYLTDSLELARHEVGLPSSAIASHFRMSEKLGILDLGIRPDDFDFSGTSHHRVGERFILSYLCWYPIIAACSFVRADSEGFHDEYVIPQLLMQWLRKIERPPHAPSHKLNALPPLSLSGSPDASESKKNEQRDRSTAEWWVQRTTEALFSLEIPPQSFGTTNMRQAQAAEEDLRKKTSSVATGLRKAERIHSTTGNSAGVMFDRSALLALLLLQVFPMLTRTYNLAELERLVDEIFLASYELAQAIHSSDASGGLSDSSLAKHEKTVASKLLQVYGGHLAPWQHDIVKRAEAGGSLLDVLEACLITIKEEYFDFLACDADRSNNERKRYRTLANLIDNCINNITWALEGGPVIDGIRYFSCRDLLSVGVGRNYVFPVELESGTIDGYSASLADMFEWTRPRHLEDFATPEDCQNALTRDEPLKGRFALKQKA